MKRALSPRACPASLPLFAAAALIGALPLLLFAAAPGWWLERGVTAPGVAPNDYAVVNHGQLKRVATQASAEFEEYLPGGAGVEINTLVRAWLPPHALTDDFATLNIGQLKAVAKPFYDRLASAGYQGAPLAPGERYPWSAVTSDDDDYAAANIGQLKYLFSFDLRRDTDGDGITDLFEIASGTDPTVPDPSPNAPPADPNDLDSDGIPNAWEQAYGLNAQFADDADADGDGDGLVNRDEYGSGTYPTLADSDTDGISDRIDSNPRVGNPTKPQPLAVHIPDVEQAIEDPDLSKIEVRWESDGRFLTGFLVERRISAGPWAEVARLTPSGRAWAEEGLRAGQRYYFRVTAMNEAPNAEGRLEEARSEPSETSHAVPFLRRYESRISYVYGSKRAMPSAFIQAPPPPLPPGEERSSVPSVVPQYFRTLIVDRKDELNLDHLIYRRDHTSTRVEEQLTRNYADDQRGAPDQSWEASTASETFTRRIIHNATFFPSVEAGLVASGIDEERSFSPNQPQHQFLKTRTRSEEASYVVTARVIGVPDSETFYHPFIGPSAETLEISGSSTHNGSDATIKRYDNGQQEGERITFESGSSFDPVRKLWEGGMTINGEVNGVGHSTSDALEEPAWFPPDYTDFRQFIPGNATRTARTSTQEVWNWTGSRALGGEEIPMTCRLTLSNAYSTEQFIADTVAKTLPYSDGYTRQAIDDWFMRSFNYAGAQRFLSAEQDEFSSSKVRYRFHCYPSEAREVTWFEVFRRSDNPLTEDVDETRPPVVVATRVWKVATNQTESPVFEIDPETRPNEFGVYYLVFEPQLAGSDFSGTPLDDAQEKINGLPLLPIGDVPPDEAHGAPYQQARSTFQLQIVPFEGATYSFDWQGIGVELEIDGQAIVKGEEIPGANLSPFGTMVTAIADLSVFTGSHVVITVTAHDTAGNLIGRDTITTRITPRALIVDANRDGRMSLDDPAVYALDETRVDRPYRFWLNDDQDVRTTDWKWSDPDPETLPVNTPDHLDFRMQSTRDLEDFSRLWVNFSGITDLLRSPGCQVRLSWKASGSGPFSADGFPVIKIYKAVEADGGRQYIEDEAVAAQQLVPPYNAMLAEVRLGVESVLPLSQTTLANLSETRPGLFLLFEAAGEGKGRLILTIHRNGEKVAEYPPLHLDLKNIKKMYARAHTKPLPADFPYPYTQTNPPNDPYVATARGGFVIPDENIGFGLGNGDEAARNQAFEQPPDEEAKCIIFVHGIDMGLAAYHSYSESCFKRFWWEGYKGRLVAFRWGTPLSAEEGADLFNDGEMRAWSYGPSLIGFVHHMENELGAGSRISIIGHSLGNAVVGSAFQKGMVVDSYAAMEAAVPLSCYFPPPATGTMDALAEFGPLTTAELNHATPNDYRELGYRGFAREISDGIRGNLVNYRNANDFWLAVGRVSDRVRQLTGGLLDKVDWVSNQIDFKPNDLVGPSKYEFYASYPSGEQVRFQKIGLGNDRVVENAHESMAYVARSRTRALGAEPREGTPQPPGWTTVDLGRDYTFDRARFDHSGQFQRNIQLMYKSGDRFPKPLYRQLMEDLRVASP